MKTKKSELSLAQRKKYEEAWLGIDVNESEIFNPLAEIPEELADEPEKYIMHLLADIDYIYLLCSEILGLEVLPFQLVLLQELWGRKFPMLIGSRGLGKSFMLAVYCFLRCLLLPGRKIVVAGASFRQSKLIFQYMEVIWKNAPLLRDICDRDSGPRKEADMYYFHINDSVCYFIPIGTGEKIRGLRANDIITDEFNSIAIEILETVISGFAVVASNTIQSVKRRAEHDAAKADNIDLENEDKGYVPNQTIISGTAGYLFETFGKYWLRWKMVVEGQGNLDKLRETTGDDNISSAFDHRDYAIIRIPFELVPKGFMDEAQVARSKATIHSGIYLNEYGAVFSSDSLGFFKRTLLESCTVSNDTNWADMPPSASLFTAALRGNNKLRYVYGIDPASEVDNFSIVILELHKDHRRIVYSWTTSKKDFKEKVASKVIQETDYYTYCGRKIRDLMKTFPCERIAMDAAGGGLAVMEVLADESKLQPGEQRIWPTRDPEKEKDTDGKAGLHIVDLIQFSSADWVSTSNHGLRKDLEDKMILFPHFDAIVLAEAEFTDMGNTRLYDTLQDAIVDIMELKNEMCNIVVTRTPSGREHFDTPKVKGTNNQKGKLRKDRYSALLMANGSARGIQRTDVPDNYGFHGGFALGGTTTDKGDAFGATGGELASLLNSLYN